MNFSIKLGSWEFPKRAQPAQPSFPQFKRTMNAGAITRLNLDWRAPQTSADADLCATIRLVRGRSRGLVQDNEYAAAYMGLIENNVLGARGVQLEMKVTDPSGTVDTLANEAIKKGWKEWSRREFCTMNGMQCWGEVERQGLRETATAGGILIREHKGPVNKFGYAVEVIEIDCLDTDYHANLRNGNQVRFGVELNAWRKPVAYYVWSSHPQENFPIMPNARKRVRFAAEEIIHIYWRERDQTIGLPWMVPAMQGLQDLGKYSEAELTAARIAACKGYAIENEKPDGFTGEDNPEQVDEEVQPGMTLNLNPGQKYVSIDPSHPNSNYGGFMKEKLRGVAAALRINYNSLANDLESVNYSSMRAGKLEEVEEYMAIQEWLIESLHDRVFTNWLKESLASGALKMPNGSALPLAKFDKFNQPDWKPRRWPWVDPQKDLTAAVMAINNRIKSRRSVIAEMGGDIDAVDKEQTKDGDLDFLAKPVQGGILPEVQNPPAD